MAKTEVPLGEASETPDVIEDNKSANTIASMLWVWKWVNRERLKYETNEDSIFIKFPGDIGAKFMGGFLETSGENISNTIITFTYFYVNQYGRTIADDLDINIGGRYNDPPPFSCPVENWLIDVVTHRADLQENLKTKKQDYYTIYGNGGEYSSDKTVSVEVEFERVTTNIIKTESPIKNFDKEDACWIKSEPTQYYLRFGALLRYIKTDIIPKIDTENPEHYKKPPMFNVNFQPYTNHMYVLPNSISLDPRVCIVRNDNFRKTAGDVEVFKNLQPFRAVDYGNTAEPNKAYIMNIYLNFNFIIESLNSNTDERGDISVFEFLKVICDGLNKSLGGINNLEPIINEETNTLEIIETTPIPGVNNTDTPSYTLQLYGYNKIGNGYISNFVRKVDLKTAITPEYATMITVGATAGGYVKGTEATAFSRWNEGLTDRFKEKFLPANENSLEEGDEDEALTNYAQQFLSPSKIIKCYGFSGTITADATTPIKGLKLSEDAISSNLSVVTEYYKWLIASQKNQQGGTIGFIPFKLSFTMNGLSGIKIYNKLHVDTRFLPKAYGSTVDLIVTGVSHKLQNNDWETDIEATLIPQTTNIENPIISAAVISDSVKDVPLNDTENIFGAGGLIDQVFVLGQGYPNIGNQTYVKKHTNGIYPAKQYPDGTFYLNTSQTPKLLPNLKERHWLLPNPEYSKLLVPVDVPLASKTSQFKVHPDFEKKLKPAFAEIKKNGLNIYLETTGGAWAVRNVTNGSRLTNHSYGFAIDINPAKNGWSYGHKWDVNKKTISKGTKFVRNWNSFDIGFYEVVKIMQKNGIGWLGNSDPMHFSIYE
jgi:hypothetical protein